MKAQGQETASAVRKGSAWGTALACGAGDGIYINTHTLKREQKLYIPDELGLGLPNEALGEAVKCEGDIECWLRYDSLDLLIALASGSTGGSPVQQGGTAAYQQTFPLTESLEGLFATFCLNNNVNIDEYTSVKVTGFTIKGEVGKPVTITFNLIAIDRTTSSAINTLATFSNVTWPEDMNRVLMSHGVFRMNDKDGAALDSGDVIYPSTFELAFRREMAGASWVGGTATIDEPLNSGPVEIILKLEFPRYTENTYFAGWASGTAKKMDIVFTGAEIESPYNRTFKVELPDLRPSAADMPVDKGPLKHTLEFKAVATEAAPAGMTVTAPFLITVINKNPADVLA